MDSSSSSWRWLWWWLLLFWSLRFPDLFCWSDRRLICNHYSLWCRWHNRMNFSASLSWHQHSNSPKIHQLCYDGIVTSWIPVSKGMTHDDSHSLAFFIWRRLLILPSFLGFICTSSGSTRIGKDDVKRLNSVLAGWRAALGWMLLLWYVCGWHFSEET